jgi:Ca2+-binding RTX toxin-like protein
MSDYPDEPMALDIAALQYLYGASGLNAGDTVYDLAAAPFQSGFRALWDAGGSNVFDAGRIDCGVLLDLNEGARSDVGATVFAGGSVAGVITNVAYTATLSIHDAVGTTYDDVLVGNDVGNRLSGGAGNDRLEGRGGNDFLIGGPGDDTLNGGDGVDTAVYDAGRDGFSVGRGASGFTVSGADAGTDYMAGIERLWFSDRKVALDLDGNAGTAAKILGAVFGASSVQNGTAVGICLSLLDGGWSYRDLTQLAIDVRLGADATNAEVVDLLFSNIGLAPSAAQREIYVDLLDQGVASQAALGQCAADTSLNQSQIDLVGLAATGLEYIV